MRPHDLPAMPALGVMAMLAAWSEGALAQTYSITQINNQGVLVPANAYALNAAGQVAGQYLVNGNLHAYLYTNNVVTDLGTLGGTTSLGIALNATGQVTGGSQLAGDVITHAFLYSNGLMQDLGTFGGSYSEAFAINDKGQITGQAADGNGTYEAFLYSNGVMQNLGHLGGFSSIGVAINASGQVAGNLYVSGANPVAFIWVNGVMKSLGTLSGGTSTAVAINDAGQVAGESDSQAFLYTNGVMQGLGTLNGVPTHPWAMNSSGEVVGEADGGMTIEGFLYSNGVLQDIGTLGGTNGSAAFGINDAGQVVGWASTPNNGQNHAFLYSNGHMQDLNSLLDPSNPLSHSVTLINATAITNTGYILAANNGPRYFLLHLETLSLSIAPGAITFGNQVISSTSASQPVTIHNPGSDAFGFSPMQLTGDFAQTNNCGANLAAGSSCSIQVTFTPTALGTRTGVLTIASGGTSYTVNLTGTGISTSANHGGGAFGLGSLLFLIATVGIRCWRREQPSRV